MGDQEKQRRKNGGVRVKYKCLIFDLDGTLVNSIHALTYCTNQALARFGLGPLTEEQMKTIVGDGYRMQMRRSLLACGDRELTHYEAILPVYMEIFGRDCNYKMHAYDGISELLKEARKKGLKLAVVSNKPYAQAVATVEHVFGKGCFDQVIGEREGIPKKPDPTGALTEHSRLEDVTNVIGEHEKTIVIQYAPSVPLSIAEEFGLKPGADIPGLLNAALRQIGFAKVFDTSFAADLTAVEEAHEFVARLESGNNLPIFTSCSPSWVKFVEEFHPEFIPNLSTCKSPQGMLGAVIKTFFAKQAGIPASDIYSVAAMPCTAKKFEATRAELGRNDDPDIDAVITVRELLRMIKLYGIDFNALQPEPADNPFGTHSSAGKLFGVTGGVAEATLRTAYKLLTGRELKSLKIEAVRGLDGFKEATIKMGDREIGAAVVSGLGNARKLLEELKEGQHRNLMFVEVMACPGGCIAGGGQPFSTSPERIKARMQTLYALDQSEHLRIAHGNPEIKRLYREFLGEPGSDIAREVLHTTFTPRKVYR